MRFAVIAVAILVAAVAAGALAAPAVRGLLSPSQSPPTPGVAAASAVATAGTADASASGGAVDGGTATGAARATANRASGQASAAAGVPSSRPAPPSQLGRTTVGSVARAVPAPACTPTSPGPTSSPATTTGSASQPQAPARPIVWRNTALVEHVPVLMYHRVVPLSRMGDSLPSLVVPPTLFAAQMAALHAAGWHTVTFRQLGADLAAGVPEPPRTLVITFDDGYSDGYNYVLPVFRQYGYVGTFFVITDRIGIGAFFTGPELCALTRAGDEIANHTVHHVGLGIVPPATAQSEIADAGRVIRQWTGVAPVTLAYPYGNWSAQDLPILAQDGYELAATTVYGAGESYAGRFTVPRMRVGPGTSPAALVAAVSQYGG